MQVTFLTGNQNKINSAKSAFSKYPEIELVYEKTETIEIQSLDVQEVAEYAVIEASNRLGKNVFKLDVGYYFEALNGYPGAFIKYFDKVLSSEDFLYLIDGKSRKITIRECLSYCEPNGKPVSFVAELDASVALKPEGEGGSVDRIIKYDGFEGTQASSNYDDIVKYWNEKLDHYDRLAKYLVKKNK